MIPIDLTGRLAVVTGASGELGRAIVRTLAKAGADVAIQYQNGLDRATALAREIQALGVRGEIFQSDITSLDSVMAMKDAIGKSLGQPDICVNAAVIQYAPWSSVLEQPIADYQSQFASCVLHNVNMAKAFIPAMAQKGWGRFIGINTECAMQCFPGQSAYAAGKRGMDGVFRVLAKEVGGSGITVNQVAPGWMISDNWRNAPGDDSGYAAKVPLKRRGEDQDIANAVLFLASELSAFITGVYLPVCGGNEMPGI